jgi:hypothetical protein
MREFVEWLAGFLRDYGPYAGMALAIFFAMMERRERQKWVSKYVDYLREQPAALREFADAQTVAINRLERAFLTAGIRVEDDDAASR